MLKSVSETEIVSVDFDGVSVFSPSWGDEFLTPLGNRYGARLILKNTSNLSVQATLKMLVESSGLKYGAEN